MKRNDKSRTDIAEALGISYYTVTDWVKGKKYPRMDKVEMLANFFGIKKSDLIEEKTIDNSPVEMAEIHVEMIQDEDLMEMLPDFWKLDKREKQIVKNLAHDLAEAKTEA